MPQNVRAGEELNEMNLLTYLVYQDLIQSGSELEVSQFSNGYSNLTYLIKAGNTELVLRRPPFGAVKRGHDMGREYKVLSRLYKGFEKSPKAYVFCDDIEIIGAPFYIMEKIDGIILTVKECKKLGVKAANFSTISESWLDALVALHNVDYAAIDLADLGKPNGYVERQVTNWTKQYLKAKTETVHNADDVMKWLAENQPKEYRHSLIHNDYKYDNVVFENQEWKNVRAILDWEMCTLGDPMMDLGTSLAYWSMNSDHELIVNGWPSPTSIEGNPGRVELAEMYAKKTGTNVDNLVFYYAFGLFKNAVIVQQIYHRYKNGLTSDPRFAHLNQATQLFFLLAWQSIQKNKIENLF